MAAGSDPSGLHCILTFIGLLQDTMRVGLYYTEVQLLNVTSWVFPFATSHVMTMSLADTDIYGQSCFNTFCYLFCVVDTCTK